MTSSKISSISKGMKILMVIFVSVVAISGGYLTYKTYLADGSGKKVSNEEKRYDVSTGTSHAEEEETQKLIQKAIDDNPNLIQDNPNETEEGYDGNVPE